MSPPVHVYLLPRLIPPQMLEGGVAVVIDVLRASTTIVHALANGAACVIPCGTVEEARASSAKQPPHRVLLGGERGGERIDGFDLGNSPLEYAPAIVAGKSIVFTTTNGTQALRQCASASRVLIGAFVNRAALVRVLREDGRPVRLVCAGTEGQLTAEDILFAGAVAVELAQAPSASADDVCMDGLGSPSYGEADVQTQMAIDYYLARSADDATFRETIRSSRGGQNLLRLGRDADVERASQCDLFDLVPEWLPEQNRIVTVSPTVI